MRMWSVLGRRKNAEKDRSREGSKFSKRSQEIPGERNLSRMGHSKKKQVSRNEEGGLRLKLLCIMCIASVLVMLFRYPVWNPNTAEESFIAGSYEGIIEPSTTFNDVKGLNEAKAQLKVYYATFLLYKAAKYLQQKDKKMMLILKEFFQPMCLIFGIFSPLKLRFQIVWTDMQQDGSKDKFYVLKCPTCVREDEDFWSVKAFLQHQNLYHIINKYTCPQCGARLHSEQRLDDHLFADHGVSMPEAEEVFICPNHKAAKSFSSVTSIQKHNRAVHKGQEECQKCNVAFVNKAKHQETCAKN